MHDGDKVGDSAIGNLVRTKDKKEVNPFPNGKKLTAKLHAMGVHFSSSPLNCSKLLAIIDANNDIPNGSIKVDFNNTCIAAKHNLYYTCLRMQKAMRMYEMAHNITTFPTSSDWVTAKEFEAILDITQ